MKMRRTIILLTSLTIMFLATGTASADLNVGLVAHYPFNGDASDTSGNGNDGTVNGATLANDRIGNIDSAYSFDGTNDYVDMGDILDMGTSDFTLTGWYKPVNSDYDGRLVEKLSLTDGYRLGQESFQSGRWILEITVGSTTYRAQTTSGSVIAGAWAFLAGVVDRSSNLTLYVNGVKTIATDISGESANSIDNTANFRISGSDGIANGLIDDVRIYNRVLSETEIQDLFSQWPGINIPPNGDILTPAADENITVGDSINFNGSGTDTDGDPMTYQWNFGAGSGIPDNNTETPGSVVFNNPGQFLVTFTVTDSFGLQDPTPDTVTINVSAGGGGGDGNSLDAADGNPVDAVFVDNEGNVGIGTTNPGIYKLAVNGTIKTREVVVETTGWSDFVFNKHYNLMPLDQLEKYIESNKHLPQIPSTDEVVQNGIGVGSMQSKLLQKIEELTLYMIKLEKKTEVFEKENETLKKRLEALEKGKM